MKMPLLSKSQHFSSTMEMGECSKCLKRMDELALKPFFIYKYEKERTKLEDQYLELFLKEGDRWEKGFVKEEINRSKAKRESFRNPILGGIDVQKIKKLIHQDPVVDMSSPTSFKPWQSREARNREEMFGDI